MIGAFRHVVTVQHPGPIAPDSDGSYTVNWADAVPATWYCSIQPATSRSLEQVASGTVIAQASHVVNGAYRGDITTKSRLKFGMRILNVVGVATVDERNIQTALVCSEVTQ